MTYTPPRERDAWFTIRGFVYQVESTIDRWLGLAPDEALELERGEDIDIISGWTGGDESAERLLEQIKHRNRPLTLNAPEARSALANFVDHTQHNPATRLRFRYVTTAGVGIERDPRFLVKGAGIRLWEEVRQARVDGAARARGLAAVRALFRRANRPDDVPPEVWDRFGQFWRKADGRAVADLVGSFEWSAEQPGVGELRAQLVRILQGSGRARDESHARQLYDRLFVRVFQLLGSKGLKRLSKADLDQVLATNSQDAVVLRAMRKIDDTLEALSRGLATASRRLDGHDESLELIRTQVSAIAAASGIASTIGTAVMAPSLLRPPPPLARAARQEAVATIQRLLEDCHWVALYGTSGSGKSELALQVVDARPGQAPWISLRDLGVRGAAAQLLASLSAIAGSQPEAERDEWYQRICDGLTHARLLVVDDVPLFGPDDELGRELVHLADAFKTRGSRLLTTGAHAIASRVAQVTSTHSVVTPSFTDAETRALLVAFGAPNNELLKPWAVIVNGLAAGHAELVVTAASFLRQRAWRFSQQELDVLLNREHAVELQLDVVRRINATVPDRAAQQLLFRSALVRRKFTRDDLLAIASVEQPVQSPLSAIALLDGLWLQAQGGNQFVVCPLVRGLEAQLSPATRNDVHEVLGLQIVRRQSVGPVDVQDAIAHFEAAGQFDRAGVAYLMALTNVDLGNIPVHDAGLFDLWAASSLPKKMHLQLRIYIRALQVAIHDGRGKDVGFLVDDLFRLAEGTAAEDVSSLLPLVPRLHALAEANFSKASTILVKLLHGKENLRRPDGQPFVFPEGTPLENFFWHLTAMIETAEDVHTWLACLVQLPGELLQQAAAGIAYELGVVGLADGIWLREARKSEDTRDWKTASALLAEVEAKAREAGLSLLVAAAQRARIIVLAEFQDGLATAEELAKSAIEEHQDPQALFLIKDALGRQYVYAKRFEDAAKILREALATEDSAFEALNLYAQLSLVGALSNLDKDAAFKAAIEAVAYVRKAARLPPLELVKALSEAAIASFRADGPCSAFAYLDEAAELLFVCKAESEQWRDVFVLLNHTVAYLQQWASNGRAPQGITADGEAFAEPTPGIFMKHHSRRHTFYSPEHETLLRVGLSMFASAADDDDRLVFWLQESLPRLSEWNGGDIPLLFSIGDHVVRKRYPEAVTTALKTSNPSVGVLHLLIAATLQLGRTAIHSLHDADRDGRALASLMRAASIGASNGALWARLANLVECGFGASSSLRDLAAELGGVADDDVPTTAAMLMAACKPAQTAEKIAITHIYVAMRLLKQRQIFMQLHRQLLLPLMFDQWHVLTNRSGFLFRNPMEIRAAVAAAERAPLAVRAQRLLRDITWALAMEVPEDVKAWFNAG